LFADLGFLNEGVEDVEDVVATPCGGIFPEKLNFFFVVIAQCDSLSVGAEAIELVDEFVDYIPGPKVLSVIS